MLRIFELFCRIYMTIVIILIVIIAGIIMFPVIILELLRDDKNRSKKIKQLKKTNRRFK